MKDLGEIGTRLGARMVESDENIVESRMGFRSEPSEKFSE